MARNSIKNILWQNKEGIIIGAIGGYIVSKFFVPSDFDYSVYAQSQSVLDVLKSTSTTAVEFTKTKIQYALIVIGAFLGGLADAYFPERWLRGLRKW